VSASDAVDGSSHRHASAIDAEPAEGSHDSEEPSMQTVTTIGFDIAKSVFQVQAGQEHGRTIPLPDILWSSRGVLAGSGSPDWAFDNLHASSARQKFDIQFCCSSGRKAERGAYIGW
jgi:hypothetical protein